MLLLPVDQTIPTLQARTYNVVSNFCGAKTILSIVYTFLNVIENENY